MQIDIDQLKTRIEYYQSLGYKEKAKTLQLILRDKLDMFKARIR